jgi:hypothetical protein
MPAFAELSAIAPAMGALPENELLDLVQRQTLRFFWDYAHPACALARERITSGAELGDQVAIGGSGFGAMSIIVGVERGWITRAEATERLTTMLAFLARASRYHGIFPHWLNGRTGETIPFSREDDGADVVETSLLFQGLLCVRQYFDANSDAETRLRAEIDALWETAEWDWHTRGGRNVLYWHWSPNHGWAMNHEVRGWNECLITYVLAASSPTHAIDARVYHEGWAQGTEFLNGRSYYGIELPLGPPYGGPLAFAQYSFLGLDPRGLKDRYADYWQQNVRHTLINYEHCARNPEGHKGYGEACWGLTAGDNVSGYSMHAPSHDVGAVAPNAALASFPYTPEHSLRALRHFVSELGDRIWGDCGFTSAFNQSEAWHSTEWVAIDQGPIVAMIENYRSGLLWRLFMSCPEVAAGLRRLGFQSPHLSSPS